MKVDPMEGERQELASIVGAEETGSVELFVVGAVASFDTAVVAFAAEGIAAQIGSERVEVASGEAGDSGQVVAAELLTPVGLEGDLGLYVMGSQPHDYQDHEGHTISAVESVAIGQEAEAGTCFARGPLIAREALTEQVGGSLCAWGLAVVYVFDIGLYDRERLFLIPGPQGGTEGLARLTFLRRPSSSEDIADGLRGKAEAVAAQVEGQSMSSVVSLLPRPQHLLLDLRRSLSWGVVMAMGAVVEPGEALGLEASEPLADHLSRGMPAAGCLADAAGLQTGDHHPKPCLLAGHTLNSP
ncbi:MAG TPA: hypothetical protein VM075_04080 [Anaerolineae bacterium]|nr:hypothetical protein [Anaerolineae bacterium]